MKMAVNAGGTEKGFYWRGEFISVPPRCAVDFTGASVPLGFEPVGSWLGYLKAQEPAINSFYIQRTYALGDVLMAIPAVRHLRQLGWDACLATGDAYYPLMKRLEPSTRHVREVGGRMEGLWMDFMLERGAMNEHNTRLHRTHIYLAAAGLPSSALPKEVDWGLGAFPGLSTEEAEAAQKRRRVLVQTRGSNKYKSLPRDISDFLIMQLLTAGVEVIFLGQKDWVGPGPYTLPSFSVMDGAFKAEDVLRAMLGAQALVCMDSGPLWLGHFAAIPTVAILGPSAPEQRLSLHPLRPEGALAVETARRVKCTPCFEHAAACSDKVSCLTAVDREWLAAEVLKAAGPFLEAV